MPPVFTLTLAPVLGLTVNIAAQIVISRLPLSIGHVRRQFLSFSCGLTVTALLLWHMLRAVDLSLWDEAGYLTLHLLSYAMAGFIFFNIINLNISSLRIRMLKEYLRTYPQPLPSRILREKYHTGGMLDARLERLARGGQLIQRDGRYYFHPSMVVVIGRFFAFLQHFLLRK